jgi:hypothetical protein
MKTILSTILSAAFAGAAFAQVPSLINYQGRLTDADGAAVTGTKNFSISIYDAATAGNLLYTESIGEVTLDDNGVYSFQFGSAGTSDTQVTETIGTTAGSTLTYTKTLSNSPVVANSITVTDGTNSWSQSVGNPGVAATATASRAAGFVIGAEITNGGSGYTSAPLVTITGSGSGATATATLTDGVVTEITINSAGSGYSGGATITIAPPVIPFRVDYSGGAITATYSSVSTAGQAITASYRYGTNGISGALSTGAAHWMAISVDGTPQATRQRVLAVPFALRSVTAEKALSIASYSLDYRPQLLMSPNYSTIYRLPVGMGGWSASEIVFDLPLGAEKIESIDLKYSLDYGPYSSWGSGGSAYTTLTAKLIRRAAGATEEIVSSFTDQSTVSRNGLLTRSWTLNHKLDPAWIYYISLTTTSVKMGDYNSAPARGINDILVRW